MTENFDPNFCFPVRDLENDWVKLAPFNPAIDYDWYWDNTKDHPELYGFFPFGPFDSTEKTFRAWFAQRIQRNQDAIIYAAYDKVLEPNPTPVGIIGFLNASPMNLCVEVGFIVAFPRYQRTHLTTNMTGLLLQYCLELPENGGLGLRRVQWQANAQNGTSIEAATRMGFHYEGVKRWDRVVGWQTEYCGKVAAGGRPT